METTPVKIGVVLPFSGSEAIAGPMCLNGARMAVAEINAAGGVLGGRRFELLVEDSQTNEMTALQKAKKLVLEGKVTAVLGPVISTARNLMIEFMAAHRVPLLYGTDYEGGACSRYLFCYSAIPEHYLKPLVPYLFQNYGKLFYLLGSDYVWPMKTNEYTKALLPQMGGLLAGEEYFSFGTTDFSSTIQRIINSGANVILTLLIDSDVQTFLRQFRESNATSRIKLVVMAFNESLLSEMPKAHVEGVITCNHFFSTLDLPETRDFVERHRKMFGQSTTVSYYTVSHYGLLMLLSNAIHNAQSDDREKIIDAMGGQSLIVGNGEVTLRKADHHMTLNIVIVEVADGKLIQKEYIGSVTPANQCGEKNID